MSDNRIKAVAIVPGDIWNAFLDAYEASLEMQPREHTQAMYDGVIAAVEKTLQKIGAST